MKLVKEVIKKIIENLSLIMIIIIIFFSTLFIGVPGAEESVHIVYIISGLYGSIYFVQKIIRKEKIITNFLDVFICVLSLSTLISLFFSSYVSLTGVFLVAFKYLTVLNIFLIVKNECVRKPKYFNIIINVLIGSIFLLCLIGIEQVTGNHLHQFKKEVLNYHYVNYTYQHRLFSLLVSANAMAAVAGAGVFLCIGSFFNSKSLKSKILYTATAIIMFVAFVLTYSRTAYVVFAGVFLIFFIILLFKKFKIEEIINKKIIIVGILILVLITTYIIIGLNVSKPIKLEDNTFKKILYHIEGDTDYEFSFDIKGIENDDMISIELKERNHYYDDTNTEYFTIRGDEKEKSVKIHTLDSTVVIYLTISAYKNDNKGNIIIENAYINGKKKVLDNLLLPTSMVDRIYSINLKNESLRERLAFIVDASALIKDNWLFGMGGNAWRTAQFSVQQYNYNATEVHCYPIQLFLECGVLGFLALLVITGILIRKLYKQLKSKKMNMLILSLIITIGFILLHSLLDFDLSLFYILMLVFVMLALISSKEEQNFKNEHIGKQIVFVIFIIIASLILVYSIIAKEIYSSDERVEYKNITNMQEKISLLSTYSKILPYEKDVKEQLYIALSREENKDYSQMKSLLGKLLKEEKYFQYNTNLNYPFSYIKFSIEDKDEFSIIMNDIIEYVKETACHLKYVPDSQIIRFNNLIKIRDFLLENNEDEYAKFFENQLRKEIKEKEGGITDSDKTRYNQVNTEHFKKALEKLKEKLNYRNGDFNENII